MSNHLDGNIISPSDASNRGVIRVERIWQHRHDLELGTRKPRNYRSTWLTLAAGSIVLGATCMFADSNLGPTQTAFSKEAMASYPVGLDAAVVSTKLRDIVDTSSVPVKMAITETQNSSLPSAVIPTKRPVFGRVKSGGPEKVNRVVSAANSTDVIHYDRCKPGCETRDPLLVDTVPITVSTVPGVVTAETTEFERPNGAVEIGKAALNGAGFVLIQTAALPFTTLKIGRDAAITMSELDR